MQVYEFTVLDKTPQKALILRKVGLRESKSVSSLWIRKGFGILRNRYPISIALFIVIVLQMRFIFQSKHQTVLGNQVDSVDKPSEDNMTDEEFIEKILERLTSEDLDVRRDAAEHFYAEADAQGSIQISAQAVNRLIQLFLEEPDRKVRRRLISGIVFCVRHGKSYDFAPLIDHLSDHITYAERKGIPLDEWDAGAVINAIAFSDDDVAIQEVWDMVSALDDSLKKLIGDEIANLKYNLPPNST